MGELGLEKGPEARRDHPAAVNESFLLGAEFHEENIDEHLQLRDEEHAEQRNGEKGEDIPSQPVAQNLREVAPEAADGIALQFPAPVIARHVAVEPHAEQHQRNHGQRQHSPHRHVVVGERRSIDPHAIGSRAITEEEHPGQSAEHEVDDHKKGVADALQTRAVLVALAELEAQGDVGNAEDGAGGAHHQICQQGQHKKEPCRPASGRQNPHGEESWREQQPTKQHVGQTTPPTRTRVVGDVAHDRVRDRVPKDGNAQGQPGHAGAEPQHGGVVEQREIGNAPNGDGGRALADRIAENAPGTDARGAVLWRRIHGGEKSYLLTKPAQSDFSTTNRVE